jgi:hypothetical protein
MLHQRAGYGGTLLLPARQPGAALERMIRNPDAHERLHGAARVRRSEPADRAVKKRHLAEQAKADIGEERKPWHQIELLKHDADAHAQAFGGARDTTAPLHRLAEQDDLAGCGIQIVARRGFVDRHQTGEHADQGGLAAAGGADQGDHFAAPK